LNKKIDLKKMDKLISIFNKFDSKYDNYHLICFPGNKMNEDFKLTLKNFSTIEIKRFGEIEEILFIDSSIFGEEIKELTDMDYSDFFCVIIDDHVVATYPLLGESLNIINGYLSIN